MSNGPAPSPKSAKREQIPQPPLVLVVENDLHTREMYAEWLEFSGFRVAEAARADQAVTKARALRPDLITTDIGLHGREDGVQLCADLKAHPSTKHIPVIAVTAWAMGGHVERAKLSGCDSVLLKPCLPETLLREIQRLLKLAVPLPACPKCSVASGFPADLEGRRAGVLYLECRECGHVWTAPKRRTRKN